MSGDIVAYINSDDYFLPGAFDRVMEVFDTTDATFVAGAVLDIDDDGHLAEMGVWRPEPPSRYEDFPRGRHWLSRAVLPAPVVGVLAPRDIRAKWAVPARHALRL